MVKLIGTETEFGIIGSDANVVLRNYKGNKKTHENTSPTNQSAVIGMRDVGHIGGDYEHQEIDVDIASGIGFSRSGWSSDHTSSGYYSGYVGSGYSTYFGADDMLANGARFYVDMGHPEYSTPECTNPLAVVIAEKAGERILEQASEAGKVARIFKNNTDGTNSYGCHENYFLSRERAKNFQALADFMTPFFVSRIIYTGSGKIGLRFSEGRYQLNKKINDITENFTSLESLTGADLRELYQRVKGSLDEFLGKLKDDELLFHLSQRADFFTELIGLQTTYNRPIINTRDEALADQARFARFHVINGDANMSELASYLKLGTCSLALDLFEDGYEPFSLEDAVSSFHEISKDPTLRTRVKVKGEGEMTALEMQQLFLATAQSAYAGRDALTDDILARWKFTLDALAENPMHPVLTRQLDWMIKKNLIDSYMQRTGKSFSDASVRNIDLQYHEINRQSGLFYILQSRGLVDRLLTDEQIEHAVTNPPEDTRAYLRGQLIARNNVTTSDWNKIRLQGQSDQICLDDPLKGTRADVGDLFETPLSQEQLMQELKQRGYVEQRTVYTPTHKKKRKERSFLTKLFGGKNARKNTTRKQQGLPGFSSEIESD